MESSRSPLRRLAERAGAHPLRAWPGLAHALARARLERQRRRRAARYLSRLSEPDVCARFGVASRRALAERLAERSHCRFFLDEISPSAALGIMRSDFATALPAVFSDADAVCRHEFDLLGSGPVSLGAQIDWHRDFKSGHTWDRRRTSDEVSWVGLPEGVDIKVPWELSRFQHAVALGKAYCLGQAFTRPSAPPPAPAVDAERYAAAFVHQLTSWWEANPVGYGVNWACTMDVAIRITNLIWGYYFCRHSAAWTDDTSVLFARCLIEHGEHIRGNLEKGDDGNTSNHYLADIVGLLYIAVLFPEIRGAHRWREFAISELTREMQRQVHIDGADYESSIPYHRLVTELFAYAAWLCRLNGIPLPETLWERLERMFEFIQHYTRPDGLAPQIGDADDGRLHILADYGSWDRRDHRYLLGVGAVLFARNDFAQQTADRWEEALWLCGERAIQQNGRHLMIPAPTSPRSSRAFQTAGYYFLCSGDRYLAACVNPVGTNGIGNHKHNDLLSFELYADDKPFIVDPGTYVYTPYPQWRNLFRSTAYHNTVRVDAQEQNSFAVDSLFQISAAVQPVVRAWRTTSSAVLLDAEYAITRAEHGPIVHRRQIVLQKDGGFWIVRDVITGAGCHTIESHLHFAPLPVHRDSRDPLLLRTGSLHGTNLVVMPVAADGWRLAVEPGWTSPRYGVKTPAPVACYRVQATLPLEMVLILWPYRQRFDPAEIAARCRDPLEHLRDEPAALESKVGDSRFASESTRRG